MNFAERAKTATLAARTMIFVAEKEAPGNEWWGVQIARRHLEALLAENDRLANALEITEKRLRHSEFHRTSNRRSMRARGKLIVRLCGKIAKQRQALKERQGEVGKTARRKTAHTRAADLHHSLRRGPEDA